MKIDFRRGFLIMSKFSLGDKIPDFTLPATNDTEFSFELYRRKNKNWFLIIFFRGSWCPVCVQDLKELEENKGFFEKKNVQLITISTDTISNLKNMVNENQFSFPSTF